MSNHDAISDERLNAFVDNELDADERERMLRAIAQDPSLQRRYNELLQLKEMLITAYRDVPQPKPEKITQGGLNHPYSKGIAAIILISLGVVGGVFIGKQPPSSTGLNFRYIEQLDVSKIGKEKVVLHIGTDDSSRVQAALQSAESLLKNSRKNHTRLNLEIVANADGLNILRKGSPYAKKIESLAQHYNNVSFLACGVAKQNAALKEGKPIELIPEAKDIPAALDEILTRLQQGWTYLRG